MLTKLNCRNIIKVVVADVAEKAALLIYGKMLWFLNTFRVLSKGIQTTVRIFCWVVPTGPIS